MTPPKIHVQGTLGLSVVDNYEPNVDTRVRTWCTMVKG